MLHCSITFRKKIKLGSTKASITVKSINHDASCRYSSARALNTGTLVKYYPVVLCDIASHKIDAK